jgi:formylmethanofuran dehydrogenase subunit B
MTDDAVAAAAALLGASRSAVIAGMGTDIAGAEAAVALAQRIGAAVDHMAAGPAFGDLATMREAGWTVTTPLQARARADVVVLVGDGIEAAWPGYAEGLALARPPPLAPGASRQVLRIDGAPETLGVLRAVLAGRRVSAPPELASAAQALCAARFGVAVWSAAGLQPLAIAMLCGIIDDLNATTRFAGLPLPGAGQVAAIVQAMGWRCGFPPRTGFARGRPEHDPWRFDAVRLVASGEADAVLWISALAPMTPPWTRLLPTVALVPPGTAFAAAPDVAIAVGCPGVHHQALLYDSTLGTIVNRAATSPGVGLPCVADVLGRIAAALPC